MKRSLRGVTIKVCGLTDPDEALAAVKAGADAIGLVLHPTSPRAVMPAQARRVSDVVHAMSPSRVRVVAVVVDAEPRAARELAAQIGADAIQLCGDQQPEDWVGFPLPILRRIGVEPSAEAELLAWRPVAALMVLDHPSGPGGSGRPVDHAIASRLCQRAPCLLAGGLGPDDVAAAIARVRPRGVDASSKLEAEPGRKHLGRVTAFIGAARPALARAHGRFGAFGGCFAPETLVPILTELDAAWRQLREDSVFRAELDQLLGDFAGRPTPLWPARRLSEVLGCEVLLKREDLLHTGAHKLNNTLGQVLLAKRLGKRRILAETGAGQHGVATATACAQLGLECVVSMGAVDAARQRANVLRMQLLGARVEVVHAGQRTLKDAVNAAMRAWIADPLGSHYVLGSALGPHPFPSMVADLQQVIGEEARAQSLAAGGLPDLAVACVGGGSNAIGLFRGFLTDDVELVGVEAGGTGPEQGAEHAARFASGAPGILHGCHTFLLQDDDGQVLPTHSISAGLDYPAVGPEHAALRASGRARYTWATDEDALAGFDLLARREGILPALESSHALGWMLRARDELRGRRVVVNLSGRGDKDLDLLQDRHGELERLRERSGALP